jgi:hypothetical protein
MNAFRRNRLSEMIEQNVVPLGMQSFSGNPALLESWGLPASIL